MTLPRRQSFNAHLLYADAQTVEQKTGMERPGPKRQRAPRTCPTEWQEQTAVIDFFDNYAPTVGLDYQLLFAICNGMYLGKDPATRQRTMALQKRNGLRPGVLDLFLSVARKGYHGMYVEMKALDGSESAGQKLFASLVVDQGYMAVTCYGADEAIAAIRGYLG